MATRRTKTLHSLAVLAAGRRARACVIGQDAPTWATNLITNAERPPVLRAEDLPLNVLAEVGQTVVVRGWFQCVVVMLDGSGRRVC